MGRACTVRAVLLGLAFSAGLAWLTPVNDWLLGNTPLYNNYNPCIVTAIALLLALVVNPLLGRRRLHAGELVVVVALTLAVGGVVSGGLMRRHTAIMAGAAKRMSGESSLSSLTERAEDGALRSPLDPRLHLGVAPDGRIDPSDPEYVATVDRYFTGNGVARPIVEHRAMVTWRDTTGREARAMAWMPNAVAPTPPNALRLDAAPGAGCVGLAVGMRSPEGIEIIAIDPPGIPWDAWWPRLLAWSPLLLGGLVAMLALAGLVRRQWIDHERLTYPIAQLTAELLRDPESGRRLPPIVSSRAFRIGFIITAGLLTWHGAAVMGWVGIDIATHLPLWQQFSGDPWDKVYSWWFFFNLHLWFSVIALTFLMPTDLSFSLWGSWLALNLGFMALRMSGVPILDTHATDAAMGGYGAWALLMLWTGRRFYGPAFRAAWLGSSDPIAREGGWWIRLLLIGMVAMVGTMVWWGAPVLASVVAVLAFLGVFLVLSRIFAESGIPYFSLPGSCNAMLYSLFGASLPVASALPMLAIGFTLLADSREGLMPYATHAHYLGHRAQVRPLALGGWMIAAVITAFGIAAATMLWIGYRHDGHLDTYWSNTLMDGGYQSLAAGQDALSAGAPDPARTPWPSWLVGAVIIAAVGLARQRWAGFILHPIGLLVCASYPTSRLAFSFFLGWLAKFLILRYGGQGLYVRLKPLAIGMVAGEAAVSVLFILIVALAKSLGWSVTAIPEFMPR